MRRKQQSGDCVDRFWVALEKLLYLARKVSRCVQLAQFRFLQVVPASDRVGCRVDRDFPDIVVSQPNERHFGVKRATLGSKFSQKFAQLALVLAKGDIPDTASEQSQRQQDEKRLMRRAFAVALPDVQIAETLKNFGKGGGGHKPEQVSTTKKNP